MTLNQRYEVTRLDRRQTTQTLGGGSIAWDFCNELPTNLPGSADLIIHAAGSDGRSKSTRASTFKTNTVATERLLEYARRAKTSTFVYISTGSVYPFADQLCIESQAIDPANDYAATKAAAECLVLGCQQKFRALVLRLFYPYGPGQREARLIPHLASRIRHGEAVWLNGEEGLPRINPIYIDDLVHWLCLLVEGEARGVFNIAGPDHVSIRQLAEEIGAVIGRPPVFETGKPVSGDLIGSTERVKNATGEIPKWSIARGLTAALTVSAVEADPSSASSETSPRIPFVV